MGGVTGEPLKNGSVYTVTAEQADAASNVGTSEPVSFTVTTVVTLENVGVSRDGALFPSANPTFHGTAPTGPEKARR